MKTGRKKRIGIYGGSFDPVHIGHLEIAREITTQFALDRLIFVPAFHAPHKRENKPASHFHRFAMLSLATAGIEELLVSTTELEDPDHPYSIETLEKMRSRMPDEDIFFVIGADSWEEITTWRQWEDVLGIVNTIVVTRPGYEIGTDHITKEISDRIVYLSGGGAPDHHLDRERSGSRIFVTDAVNIDVSATGIRRSVRRRGEDWRDEVDPIVAGHIEKYGLYR